MNAGGLQAQQGSTDHRSLCFGFLSSGPKECWLPRAASPQPSNSGCSNFNKISELAIYNGLLQFTKVAASGRDSNKTGTHFVLLRGGLDSTAFIQLCTQGNVQNIE